MILKSSKLKLPSNLSIVFNGAALLIIGAAAVAAIRTTVIGERASPCSERYPNALRMSLERGGRPMQVGELQAVVNQTDWSLLENTRIVGLKAGPARQAMEFKTAFPRAENADPELKPGVGFHWTPRAIPKTSAACLAYSVFLPEDFEFGLGGRLPGLMGMADGAESKEPLFSTRYTWGESGTLGFHPQLPDIPDGRSLESERMTTRLERGGWVALEQEVVLNAPGEANGIMRIWANNELVFERTDVVIRKNEAVVISGVLSEVTARPARTGGKLGKVWVTPFELRW